MLVTLRKINLLIDIINQMTLYITLKLKGILKYQYETILYSKYTTLKRRKKKLILGFLKIQKSLKDNKTSNTPILTICLIYILHFEKLCNFATMI